MTPNPEFVEVFLQEASEHLQFLREYSGILQDPYPATEDIERLYISAHNLSGTSASYGYPHFSEVASKLAHIFQYSINATFSPESATPLVDFIMEAVQVLESDLLMISATGKEADDEIDYFREKYPFAFQQPAKAAEPALQAAAEPAPAAPVLNAAPISVAQPNAPLPPPSA
jgi:two-component system chemotaxis sensor kinase CheA